MGVMEIVWTTSKDYFVAMKAKTIVRSVVALGLGAFFVYRVAMFGVF